MSSSDPLHQLPRTLPSGSDLYDCRCTNSAGDILVAIMRTSTARDLRGALLGLAHALRQTADASFAVLALEHSRLTEERAARELQQFAESVRPDLAERVCIALVHDTVNEMVQVISGHPSALQPLFVEQRKERLLLATQAALAALAPAPGAEAAKSSGRVSSALVAAVMVQEWYWSREPMTMAAIRRLTGASHPTVASAVKHLEALGVVDSNRSDGLQLLDPIPLSIVKINEQFARSRASRLYFDPTGVAPRPDQLAQKLPEVLRRLNLPPGAVKIGGVLGAGYWWSDLDITEAPRLDLTTNLPARSLSAVVAALDPGLSPLPDARRRASLVVHSAMAPGPSAVSTDDPTLSWAASPMDCLADLQAMGLDDQAAEFAHAMHFGKLLGQLAAPALPR